MTILVIEDEIKIARFIKKGLEMDFYTVDVAYDGEEGLKKALENKFDLIILDLMLPKLNGLEVCKTLREQKIESPILILTAKDSTEDRVKGLDLGADDYLVKPFAFGELLARIRALLRREKTVKGPKLQVGDLVLIPATHEVFRGGKEIELSVKEYKLLSFFMHNPGKICSRKMIADHLWGYNYQENSNIIDVYINYLREKIDKGFDNKLFYTLRGLGYKLQDKTKKPTINNN